MKNILKKSLITALAIAAFGSFSLSVCAAPKTMPDGTVFDAEFYAATYPDVVQAFGTDEAALYNHYVAYGKAEGRLPYAAAPAAEPAPAPAVTPNPQKSDKTSPIIIDPSGNVLFVYPVTQAALETAEKTHKYYTSLPEEFADFADQTAMEIAYAVLSNPNLVTDCQKINYAAQIVASYCQGALYATDSSKFYRSPVGVFSQTYYTCASSTRALGRVLDFMGYEWTHINENQNKHQWCVVTMDGQLGFADGMGGFAGYGEMKSGMTLPNGQTIYFPE